MLLVVTINDDFLKRRYALAEAKRVDVLLQKEDDDKLAGIAESSFGWNVRRLTRKTNEPYDYSLSFVDYLKNAPGFHDGKWKLVNRAVANGEVFLKKDELSRLLSEEVRKYVQKTLDSGPKTQLPPLFEQRLERINQILAQRKDSTRLEELPKTAIIAAYPPCIKSLYDSLLAGRHLSHLGRFTLTSFLLSLGMDPEELLKLYTSISDFSESLTRYQIQHIAGQKGSGTKYTPPNCDTLRTHGICLGSDDLCPKVRHPLSYYRRKIRQINTIGEEQGHE
jgi:DNA primase large subunit